MVHVHRLRKSRESSRVSSESKPALISSRSCYQNSEVCVVSTNELTEFLRMLVTFGVRFHQEFLVAPSQQDWRFYFLRFIFLSLEHRRVTNFPRVAAERKRVVE